MRPSIRRQLLVISMVIVTSMWLVTSISSYRDSQHEVEELFDTQLAQTARTLMTLVSYGLKERGIEEKEAIPGVFGGLLGYEYELKIAFQVWLIKEQQLILHSNRAPMQPLSSGGEGFFTESLDGKEWRVYLLNDPSGLFQVQVAEDYAIRDELVEYIALRIITPMLIALPLLAAMLWLGIRRGLSPLTCLASELAHRESSNLKPLDDVITPEEMLPLVKALNKLFYRLEHSFKNERHFTADAAHELRTPLAAIKTQAQVAQRVTMVEEKRHALDNIVNGVDRMARLVEQLLTLSRADSLVSSSVNKCHIDLKEIAQTVLADEAPAAISRAIELGLDCDQAVSYELFGSAAALSTLLRNLVDNAIRYSPQGGEVSVIIERTAAQIILTVNDTGPGIPEEERTTLLKRFKRGRHIDTPGSGLGLSIVERFAKLHGATLQLKSAPQGGGLSVQLTFLSAQASRSIEGSNIYARLSQDP
ncbi:MAG: ATP-binding protein [Candidatus Polarisedimenticolaceae bacterium]|nr:ATP-binding protein [Candidatus Polarisedimenticolaceae bacterium]